MRAISYLRFSTPEQALGDSKRRQLKTARDYCALHGLELDEKLSIADEGLSAYKGHNVERGSLGHFLAEVRAGKIPVGTALIIENLDRLSRQGIDATTDLLKQLTQAGIDVHVVALGRVLKAGFNGNLIDYVIIGVQADLAFQESAKKQERVRSARQAEKEQAAEDGLAFTPRCPSWLKAEVGHKPVIIKERAATVNRIFQLASEGLGCKRIVNALIAEGRHPFTSEKGGQGRIWSPEYIQKTLHSRAVLGEYQPHKLLNGERVPEGNPIPNFYPDVVSQSLFDAVQAQVKAKNRNEGKVGKIDKKGRLNYGGGGVGGGNHSVNSILSPLVYDGNRVMVFHQKKGDHPYLMTKWAAGQSQHYIRYDRLEKAFLTFLEKLDWQSVAGHGESAEVTAATGHLEAALAEIDHSSRKIAQMQQLVDEGSFSKSLFEALDAEKARLVEATARKEKLAAEVASARGKVQALHSPKELIQAIRAGDPELRLKLKAEIAKRISKIDITFEDRKATVAVIRFINDYTQFLVFQP